MLFNLRSFLNIFFILFGLYTLYSLWKSTPSVNLNSNLNRIPSNYEIQSGLGLPPNSIPLGTAIKEVWDQNPNGNESKTTTEEFYYNPNNTGMYYDHQVWLDNEVFCN